MRQQLFLISPGIHRSQPRPGRFKCAFSIQILCLWGLNRNPEPENRRQWRETGGKLEQRLSSETEDLQDAVPARGRCKPSQTLTLTPPSAAGRGLPCETAQQGADLAPLYCCFLSERRQEGVTSTSFLTERRVITPMSALGVPVSASSSAGTSTASHQRS